MSANPLRTVEGNTDEHGATKERGDTNNIRQRDSNGATTCAWEDCLASTGKPSWIERCQREPAFCKSHCLDMGHCDVKCKRHYDMLNAKEKEYVRIWAEQASNGRPPSSTTPQEPVTPRILLRKRTKAAVNKVASSKAAASEFSPAVLQSLALQLAPMIAQAMQQRPAEFDPKPDIASNKATKKRNGSSKSTSAAKQKKTRKETIILDQSSSDEDLSEAAARQDSDDDVVDGDWDSSDDDEDSVGDAADSSDDSADSEQQATARARRRLATNGTHVSDQHSKHASFVAALPSVVKLNKASPGFIELVVYNKSKLARTILGLQDNDDDLDDELDNKELQVNLLKEAKQQDMLLDCLSSIEVLQKILQAKLEAWQRLLIKLGLSADEFRLWNNVRSQLMQIAMKVANELSNPNAGLYYYNVYAQGINSGTFKYEYDRKQSLAIHRESLEAARNQFKSKQTIDIKKKHKAKQSCRICGQSSHPFWQCPEKKATTKESSSSKLARVVTKKYRPSK
jgi:hypothetical protein